MGMYDEPLTEEERKMITDAIPEMSDKQAAGKSVGQVFRFMQGTDEGRALSKSVEEQILDAANSAINTIKEDGSHYTELYREAKRKFDREMLRPEAIASSTEELLQKVMELKNYAGELDDRAKAVIAIYASVMRIGKEYSADPNISMRSASFTAGAYLGDDTGMMAQGGTQ